jgi:hypothetical protein
MKSLTAGSEIDAWCTNCKMDLGHRIVAMVGAAPKRVICLTCKSEHNYRAPKSAKAAPGVFVRNREPKKDKPPTAGVRAAQKAKAEQDRYDTWANKTLGRSVDSFVRYSIERKFETGELVLHSKFGEGYVAEVHEGGKVSVMFRDGPKTLAHAGR